MRRHPGIPHIAAWGWMAAITYQRARRDGIGEGPEYFERYIVDEPRRWGANLVEFYPPEMRQGYPFPWADGDPLSRPANYWGGFENPKWSLERMREFFHYAHRRGMLIHVFCHPDLVRRGAADIEAQKVQAARFVARTFHNILLWGGKETLDGLGYEAWFIDTEGLTNAILWSYHPGAYLHSTFTIPPLTPNFSATPTAAAGHFGTACGLSDRWRHIYPPSLYQSDQIDCRVRKNSSRDWDLWGQFGGGTYPDWMMKQLFDFCRERLDLGTAVWWIGEPEATLPSEYRPYVYGLSQDPLRAAFTAPLFSTGIGGYRDTVLVTQRAKEVGFGHEYPYPYQASIIQNNYLRVVRLSDRDGGPLLYDATHLAHYDFHEGGHAPLELVSDLLTTTLEKGEGDPPTEEVPWELWIGHLNNSDAEFRGAGGYESIASYDATTQETKDFPACITYEEDPEWPTQVDIAFEAPSGSYELVVHRLIYHPGGYVVQNGLMEVYLDDRAIGVYPSFYPLRDDPACVGFNLFEPGLHHLRLNVATGTGHRFDALQIIRRSPDAVTHTHLELAGALAVMKEEVLKCVGDAELCETRQWQCLSDTPWATVTLERQLTGRAKSVQTWIFADGYDLLQVGDRTYRQPVQISLSPPPIWTFRNTTGEKPDLHILWLDPGHVTEVHWHPARHLLLSSRPEPTEHLRLAFAVATSLYTATQIPALLEAATAFPEALHLGSEGVGVVENSLDIPRVAIIRVAEPDGNPYLVCEEGHGGAGAWWYSRGAQPSQQEPGTDLLKVYLQPRGKALVQRDGFVRGWVRPGWGCQYTLAIADEGLSPTSCLVEVLKTSRFLFAPRVEFARSISAAWVNGRPWRYFDGHILFLPNAPGRYWIEVEEGQSDAPTLASTWLRINGAEWDAHNLTLTLHAEHPPDFRANLPGHLRYTAEVHTAGYRLISVDNAGHPLPIESYPLRRPEEVEAMQTRGVIVELDPGITTLSFALP